MLESAIPDHLVRERTVPAKTPANFEPPVHAYCARFPEETKELVIAIIGAQHKSPPKGKSPALTKILEFVSNSAKDAQPRYWEPASVTDNTGYFNEIIITYWPSQPQYRQWASESGFDAWWTSLEAPTEQHGWFLEVFFPPVDRFETVLSDDTIVEGVVHMQERVSGAIKEHIYWGSMRDRLPISQTDALTGDRAASASSSNEGGSTLSRRIQVAGRKNLAIIRSGQNWSVTYPEERKLYLETMHPVLIKGMEFLRDHGEEVGCFSNRFMDVLDHESLCKGTDKTFGFSFFDDLASLEGWSKQHKTHLDIFGGFLQYAKQLNNNISLKLFHEVLVLTPEQQFFEYVGCHEMTGMLASLGR